jgi:hypothetical protein
MSEHNYTRIITYITHIPDEECDACHTNFWEPETKNGYETPPECICGGNPNGYAIVTCVRVAQNPIITKPVEIDFDITGTKINCRYSDTLDMDMTINISAPDHRFCIASVANLIDLDTENKKFVYKYIKLNRMTRKFLNTSKKFRGPCKSESYELELQRRSNMILSTTKLRDQNENPHVKRNKKIHRR